jgi:hypothetical protein
MAGTDVTIGGASMLNPWRTETFARGECGVVDDPTKNPAVRAKKQPAIELGGNTQFSGMKQNYRASMDTRARVGLDVNMDTAARQTHVDEYGRIGDSFVNYNIHAKIGYGLKVNEKISLGANVASAYERLAETKTSLAFTADIGGLYNVTPRLNLGASIRNLGNSAEDGTVGGSYEMPALKGLKVFGEVDASPFRAAISGEMPVSSFKVAAGVNYSPANGGIFQFSGGIECRLNGSAYLNYAIQTHDLGLSHRAALTWRFGENGIEGEKSTKGVI